LKQLKKYLKETTFGQWSLTMFFMAVVSGILLMLSFDMNDPYGSVSKMLLVNPYASWIRNIHYWSSQLFLVLLLFHLYEHFKQKKAVRLNNPVWFRLTISLLILFMVMFTGFLLRGDADTLQARQIVVKLIREIPFLGNLLAYVIFGKEGSYQLIYLNHAATFTIISLVFIFEHSRKLWPEMRTVVYALFPVFLISYFFSAPLHNNLHPVLKGPWYFVGLQDLLHWFSHPQWLLLLLAALLLMLYLAGMRKYSIYYISRKVLLIITVVYGVLTIDGMFLRGENWKQIFPWENNYHYEVMEAYHFTRIDPASGNYAGKISEIPIIYGRAESCVVCHDKVKGFSTSHNPNVVGCFSCHGGNPFSMNQTAAHKNMILIPGNLSNAGRSCGTTGCHSEIVERIDNGLMSTLSGMINVDRYVFNEQNTPDGDATMADLHHSAADEHLRTMCVRCHLGNEKKEMGPVTEESRGGGCLACHLNYSKKGLMAHELHQQNQQDSSWLAFHPSVDLKVTNNHCFGCHSRSGRISTNYEGWHETTFKPSDVVGKKNYRLVEGNRVFRYVQDDVHHAAGLECVDCHTSYELMGDGNRYQHQEDQQDVACADCHTSTPDTISPLQLDGESAVVAGLRFGNIAGRKLIRTKKHKVPLINTYVQNDSVFIIEKNNKQIHYVKPPSPDCERDNVHQNLSCSSCHTAWAPTCIGCHNEYDIDEPGYNMVLNQEQRGSWVEYVGEYNALPPVLGNRLKGKQMEIIPVIPGMILTIDVQSFDKSLHDSLLFHRLFAPAAPHTTMKKGRSCKSCHNDPMALGYGKGTLTYEVKEVKGFWHFEPFYGSNPNDSLPEDAWIPFLGTRNGKVSTRSNVTPFTVEQQQRILTAGACLNCHDENSKVMKQSLTDFTAVISKRKKVCVLPEF
jgi:formate-dependent nitrite reductase cytochrome c552 subunit